MGEIMKNLKTKTQKLKDAFQRLDSIIEENKNAFAFSKIIYFDCDGPVSEKFINQLISEHIAYNNNALKKADESAYAAAKKAERKKDINSNHDLQLALDRNHKKYDESINEPTVLINATKGVDIENIKLIYTHLKKSGYNPKIALQLLDLSKDFRDSRIPTILTSSEIDNLKFVENKLGAPIYLQEGVLGTPLTIKEVERTNAFVHNIANYLKKLNPSPFEAAVFIHNFCSSFFYNEVNKQYGSRVLGDVIASGNIVCVGYATMFKAIVDELNIKGLSAKLNTAFILNNITGHSNNLVSVEDPKYNIYGSYMEDACFSSISENKYSSFSHCLYPVEDILNDKTLFAYYSKKYQAGLYYSTNLKKFKPTDLIIYIPSVLALKFTGKKTIAKLNHTFIDNVENIGEPIPASAYQDAYYNLLVKQGYSKKAAATLTDIKMETTVRKVHSHFTNNAKNSFYAIRERQNISISRLPSALQITTKIEHLKQLQQKIKDSLLFIETSDDPEDISNAAAFNQQLYEINISIEQLKKQQLNLWERRHHDSTDKYIEENKTNKNNINKILGE